MATCVVSWCLTDIALTTAYAITAIGIWRAKIVHAALRRERINRARLMQIEVLYDPLKLFDLPLLLLEQVL